MPSRRRSVPSLQPRSSGGPEDDRRTPSATPHCGWGEVTKAMERGNEECAWIAFPDNAGDQDCRTYSPPAGKTWSEVSRERVSSGSGEQLDLTPTEMTQQVREYLGRRATEDAEVERPDSGQRSSAA